MTNELIAVDVCCGGGGWACAARGLPIRIVESYDIWEPARMTYQINHPDTKVMDVDCSTDLPDPARMRDMGVNLIVGGIPCEWLSLLRNWSGATAVGAEEMEKERKLLDAVLAWVREIAPKYWCLEDVPKLKAQLPPLTPYQIIDAQEYSGQRRKRIYVGEFPAPPRGEDDRVLRDYLLPGPKRIGRRLWGRTPEKSRTFSKTTTHGAWPDDIAPTITNHCSRRDAELGVVEDDVPGGIRQMDWRESAALQGFPEDYVFWGSPTDLGVMVGRAVQIDTGRAILSAIAADYQARPAG